jgi:hypothetical protein
MAAPTALAASKCSGRMISLTPGIASGMRMLPPPTAMSGRASREVFIRSIASASMASARASASVSRARREPIRAASPSAARPAATAQSVSVAVVPPKISASSGSRYPTLRGPMRSPEMPVSSEMTVPPPSAIVTRSGIRKLVRMPPISTP